MKTKKFTKAMICACFLMLGITLNAQTQDSVRGWGRVLLAQSHQQNAIPAMTPLDQGKPWPPMSIFGAWHLTGTFQGVPYETLMTFLPGDGHDQGAVIFTSNQDQGPPFSGTAGQGNWTRVGPYSFIATHQTFLFDVINSMPFGVLKILDAITINGDQMEVTSELIFPGGFTFFPVQTTGSRVTIEAPPGH